MKKLLSEVKARSFPCCAAANAHSRNTSFRKMPSSNRTSNNNRSTSAETKPIVLIHERRATTVASVLIIHTGKLLNRVTNWRSSGNFECDDKVSKLFWSPNCTNCNVSCMFTAVLWPLAPPTGLGKRLTLWVLQLLHNALQNVRGLKAATVKYIYSSMWFSVIPSTWHNVDVTKLENDIVVFVSSRSSQSPRVGQSLAGSIPRP